MPTPPATKLDANQVLQRVMDEANGRLRVDAQVSTTINDVKITDPDGDELEVNPDGSINVVTTGETQVEIDAADGDNIAIHDSDGDELEVNTDGSIFVQPSPNLNISGLKKYNEITSVASGVETDIVTHIATAGRRTFLQKVFVSGDNIAKYRVKIDGTTIDFKRTMFGSDLNTDFFFDGELNPGLEVGVGSTVSITVIHERTSVADFNGKIQYIEVLI